MADTLENPLYGKATDAFIRLERAIEDLFGATGNGLGEKARSVKEKISRRSFNNLMSINRTRNRIIHEEGSKTRQDLAKIIVDCTDLLARLRSEAASQGATRPEPRPAAASWRSTASDERVRPRPSARGNSKSAEGAFARSAYRSTQAMTRTPATDGRSNADPHGVEVAFKYLIWAIVAIVAIVAGTRVLGMTDGNSGPDFGPRVAQPDPDVVPEVDPDWLPTPQVVDAGSSSPVVGLVETAPFPREIPVESVVYAQPITDARQIPVPEAYGSREPAAVAMLPDVPQVSSGQYNRQPQAASASFLPAVVQVSPEDRFRQQANRSSVALSDEPGMSPEDRFRRGR